MSVRTSILIAVVLVALSLAQGDAGAQVPSHRPGTICFTPQFWCWANPPGPPGAVCYCPSQYGRVQGRLG
jgi:hypothetical protein